MSTIFFFYTYCPHRGVALALGLVGLTPRPGMTTNSSKKKKRKKKNFD
jgi:hypothetical protein